MSAELKPDTEREAFEAFWAERKIKSWFSAGCHKDRGPVPSASWAEGFWSYAFEGWQARATAAQAQIARVEAERDELKALYEARDRDVVTLNAQANELRGLAASRAAELHEALARVASLRQAGAPMANTMFNLAQREHWPAYERESFKTMQLAWDAASATSPATQEPPAGAEGVL